MTEFLLLNVPFTVSGKREQWTFRSLGYGPGWNNPFASQLPVHGLDTLQLEEPGTRPITGSNPTGSSYTVGQVIPIDDATVHLSFDSTRAMFRGDPFAFIPVYQTH